MQFDELIRILSHELSGEKAKKYTREISSFHRIQASSGLHKAIKFIISELKRVGDNNYKVLKYKADGEPNAFGWESPIPWEIESGFLKMIEPEEKYLCRYDEIPESIATHSKATDSIVEVVDIGNGTIEEFNKTDVKGKIVLTTAAPRTLIERIYQYNAVGVIGYPTEKRAAGNDNLVQYLGLWPNAKNLDMSTYGFSISRKQAREIKNYLQKGEKVLVHAKIKAELKKGKLEVLTTKIIGSTRPQEEVILIAHICHPYPSANDNASGSALLLEIFTTLFNLIKDRKIKAPERTIRFLWVPEFSGTIPWTDEMYKSNKWKPILAINLDMVGESPKIVGEPFIVSKSSISTPSYLNDIITLLIEKIKDNKNIIEQNGWQYGWNYRVYPYSGGSDHIIFSDSPIRVPSVMFGHMDRFWHTNLDTIEKVDPTELKRVGILAACTVTACAYEKLFSEEILKSFLLGHFHRKSHFINMIIQDINTNVKDIIISTITRKTLETFMSRELETFEAIKSLFTSFNDKTIELVSNEIKKIPGMIKELINKSEISSDNGLNDDLLIVPKRNWYGSLNYKIIYSLFEDSDADKLTNKEKQLIKELILSSSYGGEVLEVINLINNKNSVLDIIAKLTMMQWKLPNIDGITTLLKYLKIKGLIE